MNIRFKIWMLIVLLVSGSYVTAQNEADNSKGKQLYILRTIIVDGDTIPFVELSEVTVVRPWEYANRREYNQYHRLARHVKATLPYARIAAAKLQEINDEMAKIDNDRERRRFLQDAEKELFGEFEQPLRKLTFSQGRMLIRLIDRETGDTSYDLIREYKGGVSAFFWQGIARLFGANLKDQYDAENSDKMIEHIIALIDSGML